ncbi:SPOR domain-containing protein [Porticoccus sp. W117]|uniref:SPOR domain-containing protein n=1 Tax=Porticoccus sp. W117 TaxID=3054777 RepID=UPI0025975534|nr:SPOR domain-containing protein [Porticoccus sp. W117]MDM3869882.1 SPOR domain-containing protein [Porticoccus sp. W117]
MSIFDDDHAEPVATAKPGKKAHKNPFADPDERLEPLMETGSELDDDELALDEEDFVPLDRKRNRHLSSSLDKIRDNGPAQTPSSETPKVEKKPVRVQKADPQPTRNPFANSTETTRTAVEDNPFLAPAKRAQTQAQTPPVINRQVPESKTFPGEKLAGEKPASVKVSEPKHSEKPQRSQPQAEARQAPSSPYVPQKPLVDERPQPEPRRPQLDREKPSQPEPAPQAAPPEFARRQQPAIGVTSLTLWTLLAMAVLLAAWSMIQLSGIKEQLAALNNDVKQMEQPAAVVADSGQEARLARLENNYQALESRIQQQPKTGSNNQDATVAQLQKQIGQLQNQVQQQQKQLQSTLATLQQQAKSATPATTSKPVAAVAKPSGWVINIASLSNRDNALKLVNKAKALGTDTRMESYPSQGRTLYRVRAFGYNSQSAAEQAALRLQNGLNMSGLIVRKID